MTVSRGKPLDIKNPQDSYLLRVREEQVRLSRLYYLLQQRIVYQARSLFARVSGICPGIVFVERRWYYEESS